MTEMEWLMRSIEAGVGCSAGEGDHALPSPSPINRSSLVFFRG